MPRLERCLKRHGELLEEKLVRGIAALAPDVQRSLLSTALELNYVPARLGRAVDRILAALDRLRVTYTADVTPEDRRARATESVTA